MWETSLYHLYTINGQCDRLVETPPEVLPGRRSGVGREDFWAGDPRGFHVWGRGSLFSSNPLTEIPGLFFRNTYKHPVSGLPVLFGFIL